MDFKTRNSEKEVGPDEPKTENKNITLKKKPKKFSFLILQMIVKKDFLQLFF